MRIVPHRVLKIRLYRGGGLQGACLAACLATAGSKGVASKAFKLATL
jgi:hypothetical protein